MKRKLEIAKGTQRRKGPLRRSRTPSTPIRDGRMVIVVDDEDRENEGDLTIAAEQGDPGSDQLHGAATAAA